MQHTERDTGLDLDALNEFSDYWEHVRTFYKPFDTSPPFGSAEVYLHEMPGGQFTNLKEQANSMGIGHRWPEIARTYADVNQLFGDIVKVTPSSKVVGDLTMFLITRGIKAEDVPNLPPGTPFPESVIDMLAGGLGQPMGGWPAEVQKVVLGDRPATTERPGALAAPVDLDEIRTKVAGIIGHEPTENEVYSYLMYPQVFEEFVSFSKDHSDVSVLPTTAFFYGLCQGEEIQVHIQAGKTLFIKLMHITEPNKDGERTIVFELNGVTRHLKVLDKSIRVEKKSRPKADKSNDRHIGAPMPGLVASLAVSLGQKVAEGEAILTLEAMKMYTTITAPAAGTIIELHVEAGETVESGDLLACLESQD